MLLGYARVSTARQGESLDTQRDRLVAVGCDPAHVYTDTISGTRWSRPGLDDALGYARDGDTIVVTRLDRLGRNMVDTVTTIADLAERGINVRVLEPELDTSRPQDKVVINIMASLAEWERDLLVQRTREGVAHARAQGRVAGPKPKLTLDQARQARTLLDSGESHAAVARSFRVGRSTLYRALDRLEAAEGARRPSSDP